MMVLLLKTDLGNNDKKKGGGLARNVWLLPNSSLV